MGFQIGDIVEGKVTGITKFGAFVEIEENVVGLVHISEVSNIFVTEVGNFVQIGQTVKVKVLRKNDNGKIELSMKQAVPNSQAETPNRSSRDFASRKGSFGGYNKNSSSDSKSNSNKFEEMMSSFMKKSGEKLAGIERVTRSTKRSNSARRGNI